MQVYFAKVYFGKMNFIGRRLPTEMDENSFQPPRLTWLNFAISKFQSFLCLLIAKNRINMQDIW